jgi:hypothetical protein
MRPTIGWIPVLASIILIVFEPAATGGSISAYGTAVNGYSMTYWASSGTYTTNEYSNGGAGAISATGSTSTPAPVGAGYCGVIGVCDPTGNSSASASLASGTLKVKNNAIAADNTGRLSAGATASLWDTFTIVTPSGSADRQFAITFYAMVDGGVDQTGDSAADYLLTLTFPNWLSVDARGESPEIYQGSHVSEFGLRHPPLYSSGFGVPDYTNYRDEFTARATSVTGYLPGGENPISYTLLFSLALDGHAWAQNNGEAHSNIEHTVHAGIDYNHALQVTSASGVFGSSTTGETAVPEPSIFCLLVAGFGGLVWRHNLRRHPACGVAARE